MGILVTADRDINWFHSSRKQNAGGEIYIYTIFEIPQIYIKIYLPTDLNLKYIYLFT